MAQFANNFTVSGIVCSDVKIYDFTKNCMGKFGLSIARKDERAERGFFSAIANCEAWRKPENKWQLERLKKGDNITVSGFLTPNEWTDANGQSRSNLIFRVTHIEPTDEKAESDAAETATAATAADEMPENIPADAPF